MLQLALFFCLFAFALSAYSDDGVVLENGYVHIVNTSEPQDANRLIISISGNPQHGEIVVNASGPTTFCPWGPTSCGRGVSDTTMVISSRNKKLTLQSITNHPSPAVFGTVSNMQVVGRWTRDEFRMTVSYLITMNIPGGITSKVPIKAVYAGKIDRNEVFTGYLFGFVVPYVSLQYGGVEPYQFLATYGAIDTSAPYSAIGGYRAYSPYGTATSPFFPPSPNAVSGSVKNVVFDGALLRGKISLSTAVGSHVNFVDADFVSDYEFLDSDQGYLRINHGLANKGGAEYWFDNLNVILADC